MEKQIILLPIADHKEFIATIPITMCAGKTLCHGLTNLV